MNSFTLLPKMDNNTSFYLPSQKAQLRTSLQQNCFQICQKQDLTGIRHVQNQFQWDQLRNNKNQSQATFKIHKNESQATCRIKQVKSSNAKKTKTIKKSSSKNLLQPFQTLCSSLPSNINKKLINLIKDHLQQHILYQQFQIDYVQKYQLNNQRQNVIFLPFCLLSYLIKVLDGFIASNNLSNLVENKNIIKQKITFLKDLLNKILENFRFSIQKSNDTKNRKLDRQNKQKCKTKQSYDHLTFLKIAIYFEQKIIKLFQNYTDQNYLFQNFQISNNKQKKQNNNEDSRKTQIIQDSIKIEQQVTLMYCQNNNSQNKVLLVQQQKQFIKQKQNLQQIFAQQVKKACSFYLNSIFQSKQREISKAHDKFLSIILNQKILKQIFRVPYDFKLNLKQCLLQAYQYLFRRYFGQKKKRMEKEIHKYYQLVERIIGNNSSVGIDFFLALTAISLVEDRSQDLLKQFIDGIKRKTQFLQDNKKGQLLYQKEYYCHYLNLLSRIYKNDYIKQQQVQNRIEIIEQQLLIEEQIQQKQKSQTKRSLNTQQRNLVYRKQDWIFFQQSEDIDQNYEQKIQEQKQQQSLQCSKLKYQQNSKLVQHIVVQHNYNNKKALAHHTEQITTSNKYLQSSSNKNKNDKNKQLSQIGIIKDIYDRIARNNKDQNPEFKGICIKFID